MVEQIKHSSGDQTSTGPRSTMPQQARLAPQQTPQQPAQATPAPPLTSQSAATKNPTQPTSGVSQGDQFRLESDSLFANVASTSHAVFGNFVLPTLSSATQIESEQVAFLRSMNTVELYQRTKGENPSLELVCKYNMPNVRCLAMQKVTIDVRQSIFEPTSQVALKREGRQGVSGREEMKDGRGAAAAGQGGQDEEDDYFDVRTKDILVLHLPELKFLMLEFDGRVCEFGTFSLFNFDESEELKFTGKRFPKQGLLRCISSDSTSLNGFGFLADDTIFCWVQLQEIQDVLLNQATGANGTGPSLNRKMTSISNANKASLDLNRQTSQHWADMMDADENHPQGVLGSITLNEKYMNVMAGDPSRVSIEQLVKPLEIFQLDKFGIQYIVDMQLIEQKTSQTVSLLVLFKGDIDKMVGTKARYPVTRLAIFQLQGAGAEPESTPTEEVPKQGSATNGRFPQHSQQNDQGSGKETAAGAGSALLKHMITIEALPFYADRILTTASPYDDYCYLVTPYSLCLVRIESNRVTEIFTSNLGLIIKDKFKDDTNKMFYPQQTVTERNLMEENASQELKLDGTCKIMSLPDHRLMVLSENGQFTMITIRFDQAEIDVAEAIFQEISLDEKIVASKMCFVPASEPLRPDTQEAGVASTASKDFDIFISSHYHDASLVRLSTEKDPDKIAQLEQANEDTEKRQRVNSSTDQTLAQPAAASFIRRKKQLIYYNPIQVLDTLPTVSPICDAAQVPSIAGTLMKSPEETQLSMDFILGSGNQVKSYLTFAAASIPLMENEMPLEKLLPSEALQESNLRVTRLLNYLDQFIVINYTTTGALEDVRTSAIHFDSKNKKMTKVDPQRLDLDFASETLACYPLAEEAMVQVCPRGIRAITTDTTKASEILAQHDISDATQVIEQTCFDAKTKTLFTLVQTRTESASSHSSLEARQGTDLARVYENELRSVTENVSAISITQRGSNEPSLLVLTTEANGLNCSEILIFEVQGDSSNRLVLVFKSCNVSEQMPILPNQIRFEHSDLMQRAITDLSVDIAHTNNSGSHAENINQDHRIFAQSAMLQSQDANSVVKEVKLWFPEGTSKDCPLLILVLADSSTLLYQSYSTFEQKNIERFRFKLVQSQVLVKPRCPVLPGSQAIQSGNQILLEGKMALVLHKARPFGIFIRHGRPVLVDIGRQQGPSLVSVVPFLTGFLAIDKNQMAVKSVKFPPRFDPRTPALKLTDGYLLKQLLFKDRGIKKIKIFSPTVTSVRPQGAAADTQQQPPSKDLKYVFLATYEHRKPAEARNEYQFNSDTRAKSIRYKLEVFPLPRGGNTWNEFGEKYLLDRTIIEPFQENQVINQLEQITLKSTVGDYRNYLAIASVRIDTSLQRRSTYPRQDDEGFYSSVLKIVTVQPDQKELKTCYLENYKRSITCISSYLGNLVATMKNLKLQDLVFIMYKFDEQNSKLINPQPIPNGVQNLATSISFDGDFIIIGDAYKNLNLLKKCDEDDNRKERHEETDLINFKKVMSNKIEANVIGAYSLNKKLAMTESDQARYCQNGVMAYEQIIPLTEIQKKMFTVLSASFDGYVRMYKIKETKNLEIVAQINVMDKILSTIPLQLNQFKTLTDQDLTNSTLSKEEHLLSSVQDRKIAIVTQQNGILLASPCSELEYRAQKSLVELTSRVLPHRGCLTPMHSHLTPVTVFAEKLTIQQRTNSNAINYSKSLSSYFFLTRNQKRNIASKIGFTVPKMEKFLIGQRQCSYQEQAPTVPTTNVAAVTHKTTPAQNVPAPATKVNTD